MSIQIQSLPFSLQPNFQLGAIAHPQNFIINTHNNPSTSLFAILASFSHSKILRTATFTKLIITPQTSSIPPMHPGHDPPLWKSKSSDSSSPPVPRRDVREHRRRQKAESARRCRQRRRDDHARLSRELQSARRRVGELEALVGRLTGGMRVDIHGITKPARVRSSLPKRTARTSGEGPSGKVPSASGSSEDGSSAFGSSGAGPSRVSLSGVDPSELRLSSADPTPKELSGGDPSLQGLSGADPSQEDPSGAGPSRLGSSGTGPSQLGSSSAGRYGRDAESSGEDVKECALGMQSVALETDGSGSHEGSVEKVQTEQHATEVHALEEGILAKDASDVKDDAEADKTGTEKVLDESGGRDSRESSDAEASAEDSPTVRESSGAGSSAGPSGESRREASRNVDDRMRVDSLLVDIGDDEEERSE